MQNLRRILFSFLFIAHLAAASQNSLGIQNSVESADIMYDAGNYGNLFARLNKSVNLTIEEEIYFQLCRLHLNSIDSAGVLFLNSQLPFSTLTSEIEFQLKKREFTVSDSLVTFKYTDPYKLSDANQKDYWFIKGISYLKESQYESAINALVNAEGSSLAKKGDLEFSLGFAHFETKAYDQALEYFNKAKNIEEYAVQINFYIAKILSLKGDYEGVTQMIPNDDLNQSATLSALYQQLLGEAYINLGREKEAMNSFLSALKLHPIPSASIYFQAALSKYKLGDIQAALVLFEKAALGSSEQSALSAYHLGQLHLHNKRYDLANSAFISALSTSDELVKEESFYNIAKTSALLQDFNTCLVYCFDYLKLFANGRWKNEVEDLIAESYLRSSNYDLAIEYLESVQDKSRKQMLTYQKVCFLKAQTFMNDRKLFLADAYLSKSLAYSVDKMLADEAYFLKAEIASAKGKYQESINLYSRQSILSTDTHYGIGYAYYNLKNYQKAKQSFIGFLNGVSTHTLDGRLRLADCLFALKEYDQSLKEYQLANDTTGYSNYQIGLIWKAKNDLQQAINYFKTVNASSDYYEIALLEMGNSYINMNQFDLAEEVSNSLLNYNENSSQSSKALLNRAIARENSGKSDKAIRDYRQIINYHIQTPEAESAVLALQQYHAQGYDVPDLEMFIARFRNANPNKNSLESIDFISAKNEYFNLNYTKSIDLLKTFIANYPSSAFFTEANFYLGDAYYRNNQLELALKMFEPMMDLKNVFTTRVLARSGEINFKLEAYDKSLTAYDKLIKVGTPKDAYRANEGIVEVFMKTNDFEGADGVLNEMTTATWKAYDFEEFKTMNKARIYFGLKRFQQAAKYYKTMIEGNNSISAESRYRLAFISYTQQKYEEALDQLFDLNADLGSFTNWVNKSYLLIAKIYLEQNEWLRAKATLQSILEHSDDIEIKNEASKLLLSVENQTVKDTIQSND